MTDPLTMHGHPARLTLDVDGQPLDLTPLVKLRGTEWIVRAHEVHQAIEREKQRRAEDDA